MSEPLGVMETVRRLRAVVDAARDAATWPDAPEPLREAVAAAFSINPNTTDAWTGWALGVIAAEALHGIEQRAYERGKADALDGWASLPENVRMLITDAGLLLHRAIFEGEADLARDFGVWCQHRDAVYAGRFGRYALKADGSGVDDPRENRIGGGSEPS